MPDSIYNFKGSRIFNFEFTMVQDEDKARLILKLISENFYSNVSRRKNNLKVQ